MRKVLTIFALFGVLVFAVVAQASPFPDGYKPEENVPGWVTQFPYQRNILLDFSVDPQCSPGSGIPGADYEGTDDSVLLDTDFVSFDPWDGSDDVEYYQTAPDGSGRTGLVGVPVNTGFPFQAPKGILNIHIDNWDRAEPYEKHIWITLVAKGNTSDMGWSGFPNLEASTEGPPYFDSYGDGPIEDLGDGWFKRSYWGVIKPNPLWEEFNFYFQSDSESAVLLDSVHIATECVPEPATLCLLGLGGLMLRRRKKA